MIFLSNKILVGITGKTPIDWQNKLAEIEKLKIKKIALFLEFYKKEERKKIYSALLSSNIEKVPFCHARHDMKKEEYEFLIKNFKTKFFNIHEDGFRYLKNSLGLHKKILIEFNYNDKIKNDVDMKRIGGFCIYLSHFKSSQIRHIKEFDFIMNYKKHRKIFIANHINGYSKKRKRDLHTVKSNKELNYLKTIPKFLFGKYIALEMFNSIHEQLAYKKYIIKLLK